MSFLGTLVCFKMHQYNQMAVLWRHVCGRVERAPALTQTDQVANPDLHIVGLFQVI